MNCATLQFVVAVATGVFVKTGRGMGVSVTGTGRGVKLGVTAPVRGVALSKASTVCAAAVPAISSTLLEGRLHALRNKVMIINKLNKRVFFSMIFLLLKSILPQVKFWRIPPSAQCVNVHSVCRIKTGV
jgi:hypothetical protein